MFDDYINLVFSTTNKIANNHKHFISINATSKKDDEDIHSCDATFDPGIRHGLVWYLSIYSPCANIVPFQNL